MSDLLPPQANSSPQVTLPAEPPPGGPSAHIPRPPCPSMGWYGRGLTRAGPCCPLHSGGAGDGTTGMWLKFHPHSSPPSYPSLICLPAVFCRVYMPDHSYVTIRSRLSASVQDILAAVTEKLQYSQEQGAREEALALVAVASSGGDWPRGSQCKACSSFPWGSEGHDWAGSGLASLPLAACSASNQGCAGPLQVRPMH